MSTALRAGGAVSSLPPLPETPQPPSRPLADIIAAARLANCPQCWQRPGRPCTISGPPGDHLARFARALRRGVLSEADMAAVPGTAGACTMTTVIYEPGGAS